MLLVFIIVAVILWGVISFVDNLRTPDDLGKFDAQQKTSEFFNVPKKDRLKYLRSEAKKNKSK